MNMPVSEVLNKATKVLTRQHSRKRKLTSDDVTQLLNRFANRNQTGVSLHRLLEFGSNPTEQTLLHASIFLHHELPIRLAKRAVQLENLPYGLSNMSAIREVRSWYVTSFKQMMEFPQPDSISKERKFSNMVKEIYERHSGTLWTMAKGVYQLKRDLLKEKEETRFKLSQTFPEIQTFLDNFFLSRVGIRVLIGQHIALHEHIDGWVGLICIETDPVEICKAAAKSATKACTSHYGVAPVVNIINEIPGSRKEVFPHIPAHLHHKLFELLKNSMRATIEKHRLLYGPSSFSTSMSLDPNNNIIPDMDPITISIRKDLNSSGSTDFLISVKDTALGIAPEDMKNIFSYMFTTAPESQSAALFQQLSATKTARDFDENAQGLPLAGLGYGLPISRVFAEYFGGSLKVESTSGIGTEATIRVKVLGDSAEPLP